MVRRRKRYSDKPRILFHHADYASRFGEEYRSFDLLISQWAGPVGQRCRRFLRPGGLLLANDSHGDATLANLDPAYELVAVVNRRGGKHVVSDDNLDRYFIPKSGKRFTRRQVEDSGRGVRYTTVPAMYLFARRR